MAVNSRVVAVATSATRLDTSTDRPGRGTTLYNAGSATIFIGGPAVTTGIGLPILAGERIDVDLAPDDALYGIVATGTVNLVVFEVGV